MYGSCAEVAAYNHDTDLDKGLHSLEKDKVLPPELDPKHIFLPSKFEASNSLINEDFMLVAEFSEIEGPQPLFTVPKDVDATLDLNNYAVKILSVDYQSGGSGPFTITQDAQVLQSNAAEDIYSYVHYFTLYDIHARGFVRPMCISFITSDKLKLLDNFIDIRRKFNEILRYIKFGNRKNFLKELEQHLKNLEYSKDIIVNGHKNNLISDISSQVEPLQGLENITLDSLASNITEAQQMLFMERPLLNDPKAESILLQMEQKMRCNDEHLFRCSWLPSRKDSERNSAECIIRIGREYGCCMKNVFELCEWGVVVGIALMLRFLKHYGRHSLIIYMESEDKKLADPSFGSLNVGGHLISNVLDQCIKSNETEENEVQFDILEDLNMSELKGIFIPLLDISYSSFLYDNYLDKQTNDSDSEVFIDACDEPYVQSESQMNETTAEHPINSLTSGINSCTLLDSNEDAAINNSGTDSFDDETQSYDLASATLSIPSQPVKSIVNHLETLTADRPGFGIVQIMSKYSCVHHLLYALLIGRPVVIAGSSSSQDDVRMVIQALDLFVPEKKRSGAVVPWHYETLRINDLTRMRLVGIRLQDKQQLDQMIPNTIKPYISVLDVDKRIFRGILYTGSVFSSLESARKLYQEDSLIIAHIFSLLISLSSKIFLYYHCICMNENLQKSCCTDPLNSKLTMAVLLNGIGLAKQDATIVKNLVELLKEKQLIDLCDHYSSAPVLRISHEKIRCIPV